MSKSASFTGLLAAIYLAVAGQAALAAVEVKLTVQETSQAARQPGMVTTGVPFAKGTVKDLASLSVSAGSKAIPAQFVMLSPWDDGSIRWALMDCQVDVPAGGKAELIVRDDGKNVAPASPVRVDIKGDPATLSTGPLELTVSKSKDGGFNLFRSLKVDGKELLAGGKGLVVYLADGKATPVVAGPPSEVTVEQAGPMRTILCLRSKFPGIHKDMLGYTVRITGYAGAKFVKVHVWLENHGAMGYFLPKDFNRREVEAPPSVDWFSFEGMAVDLGLGLGESVNATCEGVTSTQPGSFNVLQTCRHSRALKTVKIGEGPANGPFYTWDDFEYSITSGKLDAPPASPPGKTPAAKPPANPPPPSNQLKKGDRTDGVVALKGSAGTMTAAVRDFWQNYEKAIELDGKTLRLWLWPTEGQWPRPFYWLTYAADKDVKKLVKEGQYLLPGGTHKGHEFILDFSGRAASVSSAELSNPLMAMASAEYYASTEAAPGIFAPPEVRTADKDCNAKLESWMRMTRSVADPEHPAGLWKARQVSDYFSCGGPDSSYWFGWMDFGDLSIPGHGPAGLHYDWIWIMMANAMRTGDVNFVRLGSTMARHRVDIDQMWSDRDVPEFNGLQRSGGQPSYHSGALHSPVWPSSNWSAGVVLYYMLTGEPKALDCCTRNAEGVKRNWAWQVEHKGYWNLGGNMAAVAQAISSYNAMYRLTGKRQWLDDSLAMFNTYVVPKWKELGPFLHDAAHQIQSQDYVQDDMKYCYSIATFCDLHLLTGDENVFKMLQQGCEKEFPESFYEAPLYLADLYAYVGLKANKPEYLAKAAEAFATGFPESKCPPVFLRDNSTWSRTSAMMLRTGHVLQYSFWKRK